MKITIGLEEAIMLDAMKEMRETYKSEGNVDAKSDKIQATFASVMHLLDAAGIK